MSGGRNFSSFTGLPLFMEVVEFTRVFVRPARDHAYLILREPRVGSGSARQVRKQDSRALPE